MITPMKDQHTQQLADRLSCMDRGNLVTILRQLHCPFDLDFTDEFLSSTSLERLRHIVLSAILHANELPASIGNSAPSQGSLSP